MNDVSKNTALWMLEQSLEKLYTLHLYTWFIMWKKNHMKV